MRVSLFVAIAGLAACGGGFDDIDFKGGGGGGSVIVGADFCAVEAIFEDECLACHSSSGASGGLNLQDDAYAALLNVTSALDDSQILVVPNDSSNSLLYTMMAGTPPNGLSPMPLGGSINLEYAEVVRAWIDSGADACGCDTGSVMEEPDTGEQEEGS